MSAPPESAESSPPSSHSRRRSIAVWGMFWTGLALLAIGFTMLDRGWLKDAIEPIGPVRHPAAAIFSFAGLALLLIAAEFIRRRRPQA